jgi:hypothetical protein
MSTVTSETLALAFLRRLIVIFSHGYFTKWILRVGIVLLFVNWPHVLYWCLHRLGKWVLWVLEVLRVIALYYHWSISVAWMITQYTSLTAYCWLFYQYLCTIWIITDNRLIELALKQRILSIIWATNYLIWLLWNSLDNSGSIVALLFGARFSSVTNNSFFFFPNCNPTIVQITASYHSHWWLFA